MTRTRLFRALVVLVLGALPLALVAEEAKEKTKEAPQGQLLAYVPPMRGAPLSRIGGGTRSLEASDLEVEVLAPDHTGLTLHPQPVLYWFASKEISVPVELSIVRPGVAEPVFETTLPGPFEPGFHAIDLRGLGVTLDAATDYEWFVSVVFDTAQRSKDVTAGGAIRLLAAGDPVRGALEGAGRGPGAADYAAAGIWYDAVAAVSARLAAWPGDTVAAGERASLLRQVGLERAAAAD